PLLEAFAADAGGLGGDEGEAAGADEGGDAPELFVGWGRAARAVHEPSANGRPAPAEGVSARWAPCPMNDCTIGRWGEEGQSPALNPHPLRTIAHPNRVSSRQPQCLYETCRSPMACRLSLETDQRIARSS